MPMRATIKAHRPAPRCPRPYGILDRGEGKHFLYTSSTVEHFTGVWYVKNALLLASFPCFGIDLPMIGITQVDAPTAFFGNSGSQRDRDARRFDAECLVVGPRSLDVRAMRQNASRYMFKAIP